MILIKRDDGYCLNISAAKTLTTIRKGLVVEMEGVEYYLIPGYSLEKFIKDTEWYSGGVITIPLHWEGWNCDRPHNVANWTIAHD